MKKVTCIVGSARSDGSCAYLIDTFINGAKSSGATIKKFNIGEIKMNYCRGCKQCYTNGECVHNDDVQEVVTNILNSDYVIIAAPSYWAGVPAQLKTFFDRNTPYGDTNPNRILKAQKRIKGIAIAVRAGVNKQENELILNSIQHYFGHLGIDTIERISICETETPTELKEKHVSEIRHVSELGRSIF